MMFLKLKLFIRVTCLVLMSLKLVESAKQTKQINNIPKLQHAKLQLMDKIPALKLWSPENQKNDGAKTLISSAPGGARFFAATVCPYETKKTTQPDHLHEDPTSDVLRTKIVGKKTPNSSLPTKP